MSITQYNSSVRQMSQSKFNSMKNSNGKIPDLANQIVMTNSEDENVSCLRTEVIYDMTSSDASKNWGYPNGIQGGITISGKNFSKYERLRVYAYTDWYKQSFEISTEVSSIYGKMNTQSPDVNNHNSTYIKMNIVNDGFDISFYSVVIPSGSSAWTLMNGNSNYYIYKIEGILKTPSMIYTGDELTAGNGISIANGVISKKGWQIINRANDIAFTVPVAWDDVTDFAFRILGNDSASFGYVAIPKEFWHNDGTYPIICSSINKNGAFTGSKQFVVTQKASTSFTITPTNNGANAGFTCAYKTK